MAAGSRPRHAEPAAELRDRDRVAFVTHEGPAPSEGFLGFPGEGVQLLSRIELQDEFAHLTSARAMVAEFPSDPWRQAFDVVIELINCISEEEPGSLDDKRRSAALTAYQALPRQRQDEIRRHLEMIMGGWLQDQLEEQYQRSIY